VSSCSGLSCRLKKSLHASERDTPQVRHLRAQFQRRRRGFAPYQLKFIDETGVNLALTRRYGRAAPGVRVVDSVPQNYGENVSLLAGPERRGTECSDDGRGGG
jgi:hypothetical protein